MKVIFIFIDGLGIGEKNPLINPIYAAPAPTLIELFEKIPYAEVDVTMGIKGLPQSATGQTAIFTGVNAAKAINRHLNGQPTFTLKNIINEDNLFKRLIKMGLKPTNTNVYRDEYLNNILTLKDRRLTPSVTTVMCLSAELPFRKVNDFKEGNGIYHDLTGKIIKENGYDVDPITPEETALRLFEISKNYDFTLFEHFVTDIVGHKANLQEGINHILLLDRFLCKILELVNTSDTVLFITSDHGNIEDCSLKTHTMNKVPAWVIGKNKACGEAINRISQITDVFDEVLKLYNQPQQVKTSTKDKVNFPDSLPGLNLSEGLLRLGNNKSTYLKILGMFKKKESNASKDIKKSIDEDDIANGIRVVHTLKGVAAQIGAKELSKCAERIQKDLQSGNTEIDANLMELEDLLITVINSIDLLLI